MTERLTPEHEDWLRQHYVPGGSDSIGELLTELDALRAASRALLNELDYYGYCSLPDHQARAQLRALLDAAPKKTP